LYYKIVRQLEADDRLSRNLNVPVTRQAANQSPSASTDQASDEQANATRRNTAN
jgi:hypothetical protein